VPVVPVGCVPAREAGGARPDARRTCKLAIEFLRSRRCPRSVFRRAGSGRRGRASGGRKISRALAESARRSQGPFAAGVASRCRATVACRGPIRRAAPTCDWEAAIDWQRRAGVVQKSEKSGSRRIMLVHAAVWRRGAATLPHGKIAVPCRNGPAACRAAGRSAMRRSLAVRPCRALLRRFRAGRDGLLPSNAELRPYTGQRDD